VKILKEPVLHFLVIGALLYATYNSGTGVVIADLVFTRKKVK